MSKFKIKKIIKWTKSKKQNNKMWIMSIAQTKNLECKSLGS